MTPLETLRAMRELLTPEGAWTQGTYRGKKPMRVIPGSAEQDLAIIANSAEPSNATCYCLIGSLLTAAPRTGYAAAHAFADGIFAKLGRDEHAATWNDTPGRTQAEVLLLLDEAIAKEAANEQA